MMIFCISSTFFPWNSSVRKSCPLFSHVYVSVDSWLLCLFDTLPFFFLFSTFLLSATTQCSRLFFCFPCPSSRIRHFSKEHWFRLLEINIRNQDLGAGCARCCGSGTKGLSTNSGGLSVCKPVCTKCNVCSCVNVNPYYNFDATQHKINSSIHLCLFLTAFSDINMVIIVSTTAKPYPCEISNLYGFFSLPLQYTKIIFKIIWANPFFSCHFQCVCHICNMVRLVYHSCILHWNPSQILVHLFNVHTVACSSVRCCGF